MKSILGFGVLAVSSLCALFAACSSDDDAIELDGSAPPVDATTRRPDAGSTTDAGDAAVPPAGPCDQDLPIDVDPGAFAKAIGLCTSASADGYGVVSVEFLRRFPAPPPDGGVVDAGAVDAGLLDAGVLDAGPTTSIQAAALGRFGDVVAPREGARLGVLSSGYAREYDGLPVADAAADAAGPAFSPGIALDSVARGNGAVPVGYPQASPGCPGSTRVFDLIDVRVTLKAPADARGFSFDHDFHGSDWPTYVCTQFNDSFVAYVQSAGIQGANIVFDAQNAPINVNSPLMDRCTPDAGLGCANHSVRADSGLESGCAANVGELQGTGYGLVSDTMCTPSTQASTGGATGWLTTSAPVEPGETFTIDFMIWDAEDGQLDSSVLLDRFTWLTTAPPLQTVRAN